MLDAINELKNKKSSGPDGISALSLKDILSLVDPLLHLLNKAIHKGIFPEIFKISKVIPVYKKGCENDTDKIIFVRYICFINYCFQDVQPVCYSRKVLPSLSIIFLY